MTNSQFEKIYRAYFDGVYRYLLRLTGDEHIAEEVSGDAFFIALNKADSFRGECDMGTWLCRIAKNCYVDRLRREKKSVPFEAMPEMPVAGFDEGPEKATIEKENLTELHRLIHGMAEPYKEVFMLRVFGELSFKQIGQLFEKNENWACVTYHRARKKIREKLKEERGEL